MAKTVFVSGSEVTPEFLNAINNPIFVADPEYDGELPLISNADLSGVAGQIKPEWEAFRDALKVTAGTGLSANYTGGIVLLPNNTQAAIAPGIIALANDAVNYVFVTDAGAVASATALPLTCFPLAAITTVAGSISGAIADLRPRYRVLPRQNAIKLFGGTGGQGDYTLNSGTATFDQSEYYFKNFTIGATATLTISQCARIFCSGNVTIEGTVTIGQIPSGGKGAFFLLASGQEYGGNNGFGFGGGGLNSGGSPYPYAIFPAGSGGASGRVLANGGADSGTTPFGGDGGGGLMLECAGTITIANGATIQAKGGNATAFSLIAGTPSVGGGGGGSGGLILLRSLTAIVVDGTLDVRGGNGSNAYGAGNFEGGGGGGGGIIALICPSVNTTGADLLLTGGSPGSAVGSGGNGQLQGGGGGFGGQGAAGTIDGVADSGITIIRSFAPVG